MSCQLSWGGEGPGGSGGGLPQDSAAERGSVPGVHTEGVLPGVASEQAGPLLEPNYLSQKRCHDCETGQEHSRGEVRVRRKGLGHGEVGSSCGRQTLRGLTPLPARSGPSSLLRGSSSCSLQAQQTRPPS